MDVIDAWASDSPIEFTFNPLTITEPLSSTFVNDSDSDSMYSVYEDCIPEREVELEMSCVEESLCQICNGSHGLQACTVVDSASEIPINDEHEKATIEDDTNNQMGSQGWCGLCARQAMATSKCQDCDLYLCKDHQKAHEITKETISHSLISLDWCPPLDTVLDKQLVLGKSTKFTKLCLDHDLVANKFCSSCQTICCSECAFSESHESHRQDVIFLTDYVPRQINEFQSTLYAKAKSRREDLINMKLHLKKWKEELQIRHHLEMQILDAEYEELKLQYEKHVESINQSFETLMTSMNWRDSKLDETIASFERSFEKFEDSVDSLDEYNFVLKEAELKNEFTSLTQFDVNTELQNDSKLDGIYIESVGIKTRAPFVKEYENIANLNPFRKFQEDLQKSTMTTMVHSDEESTTSYSQDLVTLDHCEKAYDVILHDVSKFGFQYTFWILGYGLKTGYGPNSGFILQPLIPRKK